MAWHGMVWCGTFLQVKAHVAYIPYYGLQLICIAQLWSAAPQWSAADIFGPADFRSLLKLILFFTYTAERDTVVVVKSGSVNGVVTVKNPLKESKEEPSSLRGVKLPRGSRQGLMMEGFASKRIWMEERQLFIQTIFHLALAWEFDLPYFNLHVKQILGVHAHMHCIFHFQSLISVSKLCQQS